jgi:hypothetical protein
LAYLFKFHFAEFLTFSGKTSFSVKKGESPAIAITCTAIQIYVCQQSMATAATTRATGVAGLSAEAGVDRPLAAPPHHQAIDHV